MRSVAAATLARVARGITETASSNGALLQTPDTMIAEKADQVSLALVRIEEDGVLSGYRLHYQRVAPNGDVLVDEDLRFELQIH